MIKKIIGASLISLTLFAADKAEERYDSYTYFGVGVQNIKYNEDITLSDGSAVHSEAKSSSPVYMSGALVRINKRFDFSMDFASTLLPKEIEEKWYKNGSLVQINQFDATINSMQFLGHYKFSNNNRAVLGVTYKLNSYKRYTFKDQNGNYLTDPATGARLGLIREQVATLYASAGYWYESSPHAKKDTIRYKFNALLGKPIWNEASSTGFDKVVFHSTRGYSVESSVYAGYPIIEGLEVGLFGAYSYQKKSGTDVYSDGHTKWPEVTLQLWQAGISFVWNFSKNQ
ncbi:hypothetical protein MNB_SM-6-100 [hydrothermal vent metagenome]|uniref:Uncharacterized protein n=1 Tax=hydrothermal vent metagenome TaxID=652676 RepID=A0A1W1C8V4_9ZZZZ